MSRADESDVKLLMFMAQKLSSEEKARYSGVANPNLLLKNPASK